jgi:hypothetical protein
MTTTMMEREELTQLIQVLPDKKVKAALDLIKNLEFEDDIDEHEPNAETLAAMQEFEHLEDLPTYDSVEDMFRALKV